jgi:hypothetical protein
LQPDVNVRPMPCRYLGKVGHFSDGVSLAMNGYPARR